MGTYLRRVAVLERKGISPGSYVRIASSSLGPSVNIRQGRHGGRDSLVDINIHGDVWKTTVWTTMNASGPREDIVFATSHQGPSDGDGRLVDIDIDVLSQQ